MTLQQFQQQYSIITKSFEYGDVFYNVAIAPEYFKAEDGLDFTGSYHCLLISSEWGTQQFDMLPHGETWEAEGATLIQGIVDLLSQYIKDSRQ